MQRRARKEYKKSCKGRKKDAGRHEKECKNGRKLDAESAERRKMQKGRKDHSSCRDLVVAGCNATDWANVPSDPPPGSAADPS